MKRADKPEKRPKYQVKKVKVRKKKQLVTPMPELVAPIVVKELKPEPTPMPVSVGGGLFRRIKRLLGWR